MSRTWTRQATIPDWLMGTRPLPADVGAAVLSPGGTLTTRDVETALRDGSQKVITEPAAVHFTPTIQAQDAEAAVVPQHDFDRRPDSGHLAHLGEASMLQNAVEEPVAETNGPNLRRRYANASGEDVSTTPPSDLPSQVSSLRPPFDRLVLCH